MRRHFIRRPQHVFSACALSSAVAAPLMLSSRRAYITQEPYRDSTLLPEELLNQLGFASHEMPSRQDLAVAFRRELTKLVDVTRSPVEQARIDEFAGATPVIEIDSAMELFTHKLEHSADARQRAADVSNDGGSQRQRSWYDLQSHSFAAATGDGGGGGGGDEKRHEALRFAAEQRIARLLTAYRSLSSSRFRYLYDSSFDAAVDVQLGYRRSDAHFANFDSRRQEFFFDASAGSSDGGGGATNGATAKALSSFSDAYKRTVDLDLDDVEQAVAARRAGAAAADQSGSLAGQGIQFVLALDFASAFSGCSREISFQRRDTCKLCGGRGSRRRQSNRCGQCCGRGQLMLPSGGAVVKRSCQICLGTGATPAPDCSGCQGTGLGAMVEEKCTVHVPPGAADGDRIQLRGKGHSGSRGGAAGDCVVTVLVKPHRFFNRDGSDLHVIVPVPLSVVLGGGCITVPVLDDEGRADMLSVPLSLNNNNAAAASSSSSHMAEGEATSSSSAARKFQFIESDSFGLSREMENEDASGSGGDGDKKSPASAARPMVTDRVLLLPRLGMWKRCEVSPYSASAQSLLSRGNLYVHCVGVTPRLESLTKAQRQALVDHFFSPSTATSSFVAAEHKPVQRFSEGEWAAAKAFCKHWLP